MNFRKKTSNVTKVLYIILAMCIISIISLILYSLFNEDESQVNNLHLQSTPSAPVDIVGVNEGYEDAEDALGDIFRTQTTEPPASTAPVTTHRPPPQTAPPVTMPAASMPPPVSPATSVPESVSEIEVIGQEEEVRKPKAPAEPVTKTPQPAAADPETEESDSLDLVDSVEVMSVPSIFIRPLNGFISKKHSPVTAEYSLAMNDFRTHTGIDIDGEIGANVRAIADGVIKEVREDPLMGTTVIISHANDVNSIYQNLQAALPQNITAGTEVKVGDVIGGVGQTALIELADIPHLHFEMTNDGAQVDPFDYIDFS
jgi:murein DD-endopeptidase MepM/ murein hydrolase activator NlpD